MLAPVSAKKGPGEGFKGAPGRARKIKRLSHFLLPGEPQKMTKSFFKAGGVGRSGGGLGLSRGCFRGQLRPMFDSIWRPTAFYPKVDNNFWCNFWFLVLRPTAFHPAFGVNFGF